MCEIENWLDRKIFSQKLMRFIVKKNTYKTLIHISKLRTINSIWFQFRKKSNRFNNLIKSKTCFFIIEIIKLHNYYRTKRSLVHIFHQQSIVIMKKINETFFIEIPFIFNPHKRLNKSFSCKKLTNSISKMRSFRSSKKKRHEHIWKLAVTLHPARIPTVRAVLISKKRDV